jgi:low temperature requirement protein LtrA
MTIDLPRIGLVRMRARDREEPHRVASPLELLFDLVFVVAVSQASQNLHHLLVEGRADAPLSYLMVFFAVWWAWMNFTWFASAFDTDDWLYRIMTVLQMAGVLVLAAGVHDAMVSYDFTTVTWGYVVMRLAMVGQWLRAAASDPASRRTALHFAVGVAIVQVLWVARIYLLDSRWQFITFFVLMVCEVLVPVISEREGRTYWHPHHISERYGLFTLILLGESLLASATAIIEALAAGDHVPQLVGLAAAGLVITAGMWWVYYAREQAPLLEAARSGFGFGYLHYAIFAAAGAVSAGIEVDIDRITAHPHLSDLAAGLALTLPVGVFVLGVWFVLLRRVVATWASTTIVALAVLILASALVPGATAVATAVLLAATVVVLEVDGIRASRLAPR